MRFAYLHGFASSPGARKAVALAAAAAELGVELERPDLNQPDFSRLSHAAMIAALDRRFPAGRVRFIGSSLGGWLAARWAELHPEQVDRLVLLCPGFALGDRWPSLLGDATFERWRRDGELPFEDHRGVRVPVHFGFVEEALRQPAAPDVPCPTLLIHGTLDEVVPVEGSRRYAAERDHVRLVEVPDAHDLGASIDRVRDEAFAFLGLR